MKNVIKYRRLLFLLVLVSSYSYVAAQGITDMRLRLNAGVGYAPTKRVELVARYRFTTHQGAVVFLRSMFSLNGSYKLMKGWEVGAEYRYNTSYEKDFHRYFLYTRVKYGIGDFDISYRLRYQQDQDYFDAEYLTAYPVERVFRNRLMLKYAYNKKTDCYIYADHFSELKNKALSPYRVRWGIGLQRIYKKRHEIGLELFINDDFNQKRPEDIAAVNISYLYHLKKKSGKRKKAAVEYTE